MRVVVTGGAGFIGAVVVRQLRARADQVVAIVRDPARATQLTAVGAELVKGDLDEVDEIARQLADADAFLHMAGSYRIGIPPSARPAMEDANVGTTTRVLAAAAIAGSPRIVYTSTANILGNTHGQVVDESHQRDMSEGFFSFTTKRSSRPTSM